VAPSASGAIGVASVRAPGQIGMAEFLYYFDSDNSGNIDQLDLGQFRQRFNGNVF
jgi:hypothetical protein